MDWLKKAGHALLTHRRRLAPAVLLIGAIVVGGEVCQGIAHETEVHFRLGPFHGQVEEAVISYRLDGQEVKGARFQWADGAPQTLVHVVELQPGRYEVRAWLTHTEGERSFERALVVPSEGVVRIDLFEVGFASMSKRLEEGTG